MILGLQCVSIPTQGYDKGGSEMDFGMFELGDRRFSEKSPRTSSAGGSQEEVLKALLVLEEISDH